MPVKPVVIPLNPDELTYSESRQALESFNLIKEKEIGWSREELAQMGKIKNIF